MSNNKSSSFDKNHNQENVNINSDSSTSPTPIPVNLSGSPKSKNKSKSKSILVFMLVVLIITGLGAFWWWFSSRSKVETGGKVSITYWGVNEDPRVMTDLIEIFKSQNPNILINYIDNVPTEYRQRLNNNLLREVPEVDAFRFHSTWIPMFSGLLSPVPSHVYSNQEYEALFYPVVIKNMAQGGRYFGIPLHYDGISLFFNEDIFISADMKPPTDWISLRNASGTLAVRDQATNLITGGIAYGTTLNVDYWQDILALIMVQADANLLNPTTVQAADALAQYKFPLNVQKSWDTTLPRSTESFATGRLAMYFGTALKIPEIMSTADSAGYDLRFKVLPVPQLPEVNVTWANYWVEGVSSKSSIAKQNAAWEFISFLSSKDIMEKKFQLQVKYKGMGMPYSRKDMAHQLSNHPQLGAFIVQANSAKSWFLTGNTTDVNGLNDKISKIYMRVVDQGELKNVETDIKNVLAEYGL